ncbi:MAG: histidinol dehydrogenase [Candidatus Magasanikbacteria bacterium]
MTTQETVKQIIENVKKNGDTALEEYALKFNNAKIDTLKISQTQIQDAYKKVDTEIMRSLKVAIKNITKFNKNILSVRERPIQTSPGITCWREFRPIEKVGLYIPGGRAKYPSTVLMLGIPAKLAGCSDIIMCSPPPIAAVTLVAADIVGIKNIYQVGGAQAIAAMAFGTKTIPQVYKIFGPGNKYVTEAKIQVSNTVAIDMPAGPSEIAILADETANPKFIEKDLASQLEHGPDSVAILITWDKKLAQKIKIGKVKLVPNMTEAIKLVNEIAPEHLEIMAKNEKHILSKIINAGSIFLGNYSPVSAGDYVTGPNHTLPTAGWSKTYGALSVEDFGKKIEVQRVTKQGLKKIKNTITTIARAEGLNAHADSIETRFLKQI